MQDYIEKNQVEIAPETPANGSRTFYLPHHAFKKQKNQNVKYRIVFDLSSHSPRNPSLNEVLEQGPNQLPEVLATLLRFRLHKQAIIIQDAFQQPDTWWNGPDWLSLGMEKTYLVPVITGYLF
ncbi:hypothetical protein AVEN_9547-1 [Araneus ventricosus]|uniref:Uncharacterized protein n=1 Tax=Araneus ventricosus TaxID=182803 RepID=A0A4Y2RRW3_ARAVE|nr:hypothetical protein AVEN_9547-1 [Araneus ventricosus]